LTINLTLLNINKYLQYNNIITFLRKNISQLNYIIEKNENIINKQNNTIVGLQKNITNLKINENIYNENIHNLTMQLLKFENIKKAVDKVELLKENAIIELDNKNSDNSKKIKKKCFFGLF
jgi:hypothetical protein